MVKSLNLRMIIRLSLLVISSIIIITHNSLITQLIILSLHIIVTQVLLRKMINIYLHLLYIVFFIVFYIVSSIIIQWIFQGYLRLTFTILTLLKMINLSLAALSVLATLRLNVDMLKSSFGKMLFYVFITYRLLINAYSLMTDSYHVVKINYGFRSVKGLFALPYYYIRIVSVNIMVKSIEHYEALILRILSRYR